MSAWPISWPRTYSFAHTVMSAALSLSRGMDVDSSENRSAGSERGSRRGGTPPPVRPRRVGGLGSGRDRRARRLEADVGESQMTGRGETTAWRRRVSDAGLRAISSRLHDHDEPALHIQSPVQKYQ